MSYKNVIIPIDKLVVDNHNLCTPRVKKIEYGILGDIHRGEHSFQTWLYDPPNSHTHNFSEILLSGKAHLALHRRNIDSFTQTVNIAKTSGDKSGVFHIGPQQELFAGMKYEKIFHSWFIFIDLFEW